MSGRSQSSGYGVVRIKGASAPTGILEAFPGSRRRLVLGAFHHHTGKSFDLCILSEKKEAAWQVPARKGGGRGALGRGFPVKTTELPLANC